MKYSIHLFIAPFGNICDTFVFSVKNILWVNVQYLFYALYLLSILLLFFVQYIVLLFLKWQDFLDLSRFVSDEQLNSRINSLAPNKCCTLVYTVSNVQFCNVMN